MSNSTLIAEDVSVEFSGLRALDGVTLKLDPGEIVGLIGPNGSGKTTLINAITGQVPLAGGEVRLGEAKLSGLSPRSIALKGIARSFQIVRLFNNLTVIENIESAALAHGDGLRMARQKAAALLEELRSQPPASALPRTLQDWLVQEFGIRSMRAPEWSESEIYLSMPRPGGDAWISIDLEGGAVEYERTDRGWISYLNDLHKGRNAGTAWSWFIDVFAVATMVFAITGLFLLQMHAGRRPATWPVVGLGLVVPLLLAILFIH